MPYLKPGPGQAWLYVSSTVGWYCPGVGDPTFDEDLVLDKLKA